MEQAEYLTLEAQNAFLKLFEEPPDDTLIILTVSNPNSLLPTVTSRAQVISVKSPPKKQLETYFRPRTDNFDSFYAFSNGRVGLLAAMINDNQVHPLAEAIETAKQLLASSRFERLIQINELAKLNDYYLILEALQLIADRSINLAADQNNIKLARRWQKILKSTYDTKIALQKRRPN